MEFQMLDQIYNHIKNDRLNNLVQFNQLDIDLVLKLRFPNKILETKKQLCEYRIHGKEFRTHSINRFKVCAITGIDHNICEAAHILPYCKCSPHEKYDNFNCILLSANMHKSFDKNYFTIDPLTAKIKIMFDNLRKDNIDLLAELGLDGIDGMYIKQLDNPVSKNYLERRNIFYS